MLPIVVNLVVDGLRLYAWMHRKDGPDAGGAAVRK